MIVKMITTMAGPDGCSSSGQEVPVDEKTGKELVSGGFAVEVAAVLPPENRVKVRPKARVVKGRK